MKHIIFILPFFFAIAALQAQNTITATYNSGDIPTSFDLYDESCNGQSATLSITLPAGDNYTVTSVIVAYNMTALAPGYMSDQRSLINFQNTGAQEVSEAVGLGDEPGTDQYYRTITIANGTYPGGTELIFQMRARRTYEGTVGCNTIVNKVDFDTWTITVHYGNVVTNPKVGINTSSPSQTMDVAGKLKLGDDTTAPVAGVVRWNAATQDFEGYNGTEWLSFTINRGDGWGNRDIAQNGSAVDSDGAASDLFGRSVSISGDYAIIGAYFKDVASNDDQGKAYIFKRSGTSWTQQAGLTASDGATDDFFGSSVSISGDYAVVGALGKDVASNTNQGKVYIFKRSGTSWTQQAGLTASDGAVNDFFGRSVSISGDYAAVGVEVKDVANNGDQGKVYIFKRSGTSWTQQADFTASDGAAGDYFGRSVSISGDYAIVGADWKNVGSNNRQGKVYIFKRSGASWTQQAGLTASDGAADDLFGRSVSISGDYATVGAAGKDIGANTNQGTVYIFKRSGTSWTQQASFTASDGATDDSFGFSVSISGDFAIIGTLKDVGSNVDQGKAYIFKRSGTSWTQQAGLTASDGAADDQFGISVSISGDYAIVGAYWKDIGSNVDQGKVYFFNKE
ncbi:MAG: FG-GAP repeat protein [Saprospiraceae bacterium]|nr:FG-GAP repeat protein [Saprospiraceae bacterium]